MEQEFKATYGDEEVVGVNPVFNQHALEPLVAAYDKTKSQLEELLDHYETRLHSGKPVPPKQVSLRCNAHRWYAWRGQTQLPMVHSTPADNLRACTQLEGMQAA